MARGAPGRSGALRLALLAASWVITSPARAQTVGDTELLFGMSGPFSGTAKEMGAAVRAGIEVAFAAQNEAGGVHGRKLRLVAVDDGFEPARTTAALRELANARKVFGFLGCAGTPGAQVAVPFANERGILFFGAVSGASFLRNNPPDRYVFNYRASYAEETAAIVRYLVEVRRIAPARIAVFVQDDAFGEAGFEGVARIMRQYRRDPAKVLRVSYRRNTADVDDAAKEIVRHAKDLGAIVMVATHKPAARLIERLRDAKVRGLVYTNVSDVGANALAEELAQLGTGYAEGVVVTQVVPNPASKATALMRFQDEMRRHGGGERPGFMALEGWITARILVEGLQRAGRSLTTDRLIDALEGLRGLDLGIGTPLGFGPSEHQASHMVWGTVMDAKGQLKPIELK
jgi:ABC-type branched-subunit amino acid transport system substrate-binding protein